MRQVLSWRFLATIGALLGLVVLINAAFGGDDEGIEEIAGASEPLERDPGLFSLVLETQSEGFAMSPEGTSEGQLTLTLPPVVDGADARTVRIFAGTSGEVTCGDLTKLGGCAVLAEMLGDTVSWFALVPVDAAFRLELPAIDELDGGLAHLVNGWAVPYAPVIDRTECGNAETFSEFLRTVGPAHTSLFELGEGEITAVTC